MRQERYWNRKNWRCKRDDNNVKEWLGCIVSSKMIEINASDNDSTHSGCCTRKGIEIVNFGLINFEDCLQIVRDPVLQARNQKVEARHTQTKKHEVRTLKNCLDTVPSWFFFVDGRYKVWFIWIWNIAVTPFQMINSRFSFQLFLLGFLLVFHVIARQIFYWRTILLIAWSILLIGWLLNSLDFIRFVWIIVLILLTSVAIFWLGRRL